MCRDPSHFRCFDTAAEKLDEMWTGRPVLHVTVMLLLFFEYEIR